MPSVGLGVSKIWVQAEGVYRAIYAAKFAESIYVIHAYMLGHAGMRVEVSVKKAA